VVEDACPKAAEVAQPARPKSAASADPQTWPALGTPHDEAATTTQATSSQPATPLPPLSPTAGLLLPQPLASANEAAPPSHSQAMAIMRRALEYGIQTAEAAHQAAVHNARQEVASELEELRRKLAVAEAAAAQSREEAKYLEMHASETEHSKAEAEQRVRQANQRAHLAEERAASAERSLQRDEDELAKLADSFQSQLRVLNSRRAAAECVICMTKDRGVFFRPCGHVVTCHECGEGLGACPKCREPIAEKIRAFM
jgi:flagellar biosynthesis GTPase FlhF